MSTHDLMKIDKDKKSLDKSYKIKRGYKALLEYKGTLKRDVDIKKERLEALDEKYNHFS